MRRQSLPQLCIHHEAHSRQRPSIRHDIQYALQRLRRLHHRHSRLRPYLPHDPKSLTPGSTQERNADIRHVSKENIGRDPPRLKENTPECSDEHQAMKSAPLVSSSENRCAADRLQWVGGDLG